MGLIRLKLPPANRHHPPKITPASRPRLPQKGRKLPGNSAFTSTPLKQSWTPEGKALPAIGNRTTHEPGPAPTATARARSLKLEPLLRIDRQQEVSGNHPRLNPVAPVQQPQPYPQQFDHTPSAPPSTELNLPTQVNGTVRMGYTGQPDSRAQQAEHPGSADLPNLKHASSTHPNAHTQPAIALAFSWD
ncbi:hypothetical protein RSOLAG22IIIB_07757 [Rhizoctonia solani]|uniref:Uncharacterized protein n=1 Tax=Rhizoctonia solani TaxID=456999 RepID=A0A0K6FPM6_9AGAM|nr:hypothetical protein RSOLAG22IIIB_07757 [Rhizoctonia solani]